MMKTLGKSLGIFGLASAISLQVLAQKTPPSVVAGIPVNYNESETGSYTLPPLLQMQNGKEVSNKKDWEKRRAEILKLVEDNQFGKAPGRPSDLHFDVFDKGTPAFEGKAIRKQVTVYFTKDTSDHKMDLLIYLPANSKHPVPILLNTSFVANSTAIDDPGIKKGMVWTREGKTIPAPAPGTFGKMNILPFIEQGFGFATLCYTSIEPDFADGIKYGIRSLYLKPGATTPADNEWGAIAAWSWGLSRAMDYFETDKQIDAKRVAITGASRLGKTVLWAGAKDQRIAMVIASCSGEGGAAISRRNYGETVAHITSPTRYFYQFAKNYQKIGEKDLNQSPVDAHMLVSLIAPRPLLLQTGDEDFWSDPKGEFIAATAAEPVYRLFGKSGPGVTEMPEANQTSLLNPLGYYMHKGGHGTIPSDWNVYIEFMKKHL